MKSRRWVDALRTHRMLAIVIPMFVLFAVINPRFLTVRNLTNVLQQFSVDGLIALGMTVVIIGAGFDLAVGAVEAAAGVAAVAALQHAGVPGAVLAGLAVGLIGGLLNGVFTTKLGLSPFIASLGTMLIARGVVMGVTDAKPISYFDETFDFLGNGRIGEIPVPAIILLVVAILLHIFLTRTRPGRQVFALGGNEEAARVTGVPTDRIKAMTYLIGGALAGLSGLLLASRLATGSPVVGEDASLTAVSAVLLGGTSLAGGKGSVVQTVEGTLFMSLLVNGMNLLKVSAYYQTLIQGLCLIVVVVIDVYSNRTRFAGRERRAA